jgi:hypothetical protein
VEFIHAICPNYDRKTYKLGGESIYLDGPFKSYHVVVDGEKIVKDKDFQSFPVACFNWGRDDGDDYGTSPVIELLTEVREINAVRKGTLRSLQNITDPALALGGKLDWLPPIDPGSRHPGMIDENGRLLAQPIVTGARPDYAFQYIEQSRNTIQEGLYVNLFQTLVSKPSNQTATEALIRQEEKGALLGPAGSSIQGFPFLRARACMSLTAGSRRRSRFRARASGFNSRHRSTFFGRQVKQRQLSSWCPLRRRWKPSGLAQRTTSTPTRRCVCSIRPAARRRPFCAARKSWKRCERSSSAPRRHSRA